MDTAWRYRCGLSEAMLLPVSLLVLLCCVISCHSRPSALDACVNPANLSDPRIASSTCLSLHADWQLSSPSFPSLPPIAVPSVPSDLISDLHRAGLIPDPYRDLNFLNASLWSSAVWRYERSIALLPEELQAARTGEEDVWLVFDGIKMGANISINGQHLLTAVNQHQRHVLSLAAVCAAFPALLSSPTLSLSVAFDPAVPVHGLFAQYTGGWDWAPYSSTAQADGTPTFSFGLWKDVYLLRVRWLAITAVAPLITYTGAFPTQPLKDGEHAPFLLNLTLHLRSPAAAPTSAVVTVCPSWSPQLNRSFSLPSVPVGASTFSLLITVPASSIALWWPHSLSSFGRPALYPLTIMLSGPAGQQVVTHRTVGFRFVAQVTGNDTDAEWRQRQRDGNGSGLLGMRLRVNGVSLFARGANVVPMDELEGRWTAAAHRQLALSAAAAGINLLRIWGGGVFLPSTFYTQCDVSGLLIYHDLMHRGALTGHASELPAFSDNIRRLSQHPSVALWSGCNECEPDEGQIAAVLLPLLLTEDSSRLVWPASPSQGWTSGVNTLSGLPNGQPLVPRTDRDSLSSPQAVAHRSDGNGSDCLYLANHDIDGAAIAVNSSSKEQCCSLCQPLAWCRGAVYHDSVCWLKQNGFIYPRVDSRPYACLLQPNSTDRKPLPLSIETHGPYQFGSGWPAVNGHMMLDIPDDPFPSAVDLSVKFGIGQPSLFTSEFGCVGFSSFESMSANISPQHWSLHGDGIADQCTETGFSNVCTGSNVLAQRNYPCDNLIRLYFPSTFNLSTIGREAFQSQLYFCLLSQALTLKAQIDSQRLSNSFGLLVWQMNEVWPTGGWGLVEYGAAGQPGQLTGGRWKPIMYWLRRGLFADLYVGCGVASNQTLWCLMKNDAAEPVIDSRVVIQAIDLLDSNQLLVLVNLSLSLAAGPGTTQWLSLPDVITDYTRYIIVMEWAKFMGFSLLSLPKALQLSTVNLTYSLTVINASCVQVHIVKHSAGVALWVELTSEAAGWFSDNAFVMYEQRRVVDFLPIAGNESVDAAELKRTLRVESCNEYMTMTDAESEQTDKYSMPMSS